MLISEVKSHLTGMLHGGTLKKVRNLDHALERAASSVLTSIKPIESERNSSLTSLIYDDIYNYPLPSDFGWLIDLRPQATRSHLEQASRRFSTPFDLKKMIASRELSIEGNDGTRFIRINWDATAPISINDMNSLTANGTWSAVGTASDLKAQKLFKVTGNASIEFDVAVTGDGIQNTTLSTINLTEEDEIADVFAWVHIPNADALSKFTSATVRWGNDVSANYWESAAQTTRADGTDLQVGWNRMKWEWSGATETGTVDPANIDSFRIVFAVTSAISNLKVDGLVFAVGEDFTLKYYSKYGFKNSSGAYIQRPTSDNDEVVFGDTSLQCFLEEARKECAAQMEGVDASFDIDFANRRLNGEPGSPDPIQRMGLYAKYRAENPAQTQRAVRSWANPRSGNQFRR